MSSVLRVWNGMKSIPGYGVTYRWTSRMDDKHPTAVGVALICCAVLVSELALFVRFAMPIS